MTSQSINEEDAFAAAIEIDDRANRSAYLDEACGGDERLRASVDELLALHDTADGFLETPALGAAVDVPEEQPGQVIGRYRLVERLGEGGFGVVWQAEQQEPVRRQVALKIIKLGMDTRQIVAHFEAERQALAMMNHGNIATVLDAGSTDRGRPYFVMELVDGQAIDDFCDEQRLRIRERLLLFAAICHAVQHAHQKGILHRDLKPSNILVGICDGRPVPKVIDFGIAKAMHAPLAGESVTASQQLVGTPEYMSPEQVNSDPDIDTRADVYALGCLLYRLLVGVAPLDAAALRRANLDELVRAIREDEPVRPSKKLADSTDHAEGTGIRDACGISPRKLHGDLDWIVMKALEKDRTRRYESVADLARDIERHLACEPVSAGSPGVLYRAQKFVRRNRVWVLATCLVFVALIAGSIAAAVGLVGAERERQNAGQQRQRAEFERRIAAQERQVAEQQRSLALAEAEKSLHIAQMLERLIAGASPQQGNRFDFTVRQQLDEFAKSLDRQLENHPQVEAKLRRTIGQSYLALVEIHKAGPHLIRALALRLQLFRNDHPLVLESQVDYAQYLVRASQLQAAEQEVEAALSSLRKSGPSDTLTRALECVGRVRVVQQDFEGAHVFTREAWHVARQVHGAEHPTTLGYQSLAGFAAVLNRELDEAQRLTRDAFQRLSARWPDHRFEIGLAKYYLARVLIEHDELDEAKQLMHEVIAEHVDQLGEGSKYVVRDLAALANILRLDEEWAEAEEVAREAVEKADRLTDERTLVRAFAYARLASIVQRDHPSEAVDLRAEAIESRRSLVGNHHTVAIQLRVQAAQLRNLGRWPEAAECYHQAIRILREHPERSQGLALTLHRLADLLRAAGDPAQAVVHLRETISIKGQAGYDAPLARIDCIETLIALDNLGEARRQTDEWTEFAKHSQLPGIVVVAQTSQAQLRIALGEYQAARQALHHVLGHLPKKTNRRTRARIAGVLADCRIRMGEFRAAERLLLKQESDVRTALSPLDRRRVARQLVKLYEAWNKPNEAARRREHRKQ